MTQTTTTPISSEIPGYLNDPGGTRRDIRYWQKYQVGETLAEPETGKGPVIEDLAHELAKTADPVAPVVHVRTPKDMPAEQPSTAGTPPKKAEAKPGDQWAGLADAALGAAELFRGDPMAAQGHLSAVGGPQGQMVNFTPQQAPNIGQVLASIRRR